LNRENLNAMNIRKVNPNGPVGANAPLPLSRNGARNLAIIQGRASNPVSNNGGSLVSVA
jgi:hypothetical protein